MTESIDWSAVGRASAARRQTVTAACAQCGQAITGTTRRRYCSPRCKVAAFRARAKAKHGLIPIDPRDFDTDIRDNPEYLRQGDT